MSYIEMDSLGLTGGTNVLQDPFLNATGFKLPKSSDSAMGLALYLAYLNPRFTKALQQKGSFFITDIELDQQDQDADETKKTKEYLVNKVGIFKVLKTLVDAWSVYGNGYMTFYRPFDRNIILDNGSSYSVAALRAAGFKAYYAPDKQLYHVRSHDGKIDAHFRFIDTVKSVNDDIPIPFRIIDPTYISLIHRLISCKTDYIYDFEPSVRKYVDNPELHAGGLDEIPQDMLGALAGKKDFKFNSDYIFHFRLPAIPGVAESGMGIPPSFEFFRPLHRLQVYRNIDETVGREYMLPFRIFSPAGNSQNYNDFLANQNVGKWRSAISRVISTRKADPTKMHSFPFPVTYQEFGGDGKSLTPKDQIDWHQNDLLHSAGFPVELFNASLAWQAMPMALRLFESANMDLYHELNRCVQWIVSQVAKIQGKDTSLAVKLTRPTIADNVELRNLRLQLMQAGQLSAGTALQPLGIQDPVAEFKKRQNEDAEMQEIASEVAAEAEQRQMAGPAGLSQSMENGQPGQGVTPTDLNEQAMITAEEWMSIPQDADRRMAMQQVRMADETLYALAMQAYEDLKASAKSQGLDQARQSYQQTGPQG
jgi:hypothetical protein